MNDDDVTEWMEPLFKICISFAMKSRGSLEEFGRMSSRISWTTCTMKTVHMAHAGLCCHLQLKHNCWDGCQFAQVTLNFTLLSLQKQVDLHDNRRLHHALRFPMTQCLEHFCKWKNAFNLKFKDKKLKENISGDLTNIYHQQAAISFSSYYNIIFYNMKYHKNTICLCFVQLLRYYCFLWITSRHTACYDNTLLMVTAITILTGQRGILRVPRRVLATCPEMLLLQTQTSAQLWLKIFEKL